MSNENLEYQDIIEQEPSFIDQAAKKSRNFAKKMHEMGFIYALYGALDGLSGSHSLHKLLFDWVFTDSSFNSSDELHDWLMTPEGLIVALTSSLTLICFSMLANKFSDDDKNIIKRYIATTWPYIRDALKAIKNITKSLKNILSVVDLFGGMDLRFLFLPLSLSLGVLAIVNRLWLRQMIEMRKEMMKSNARILDAIKNSKTMQLEDLEELYQQKQKQSVANRTAGLLSAGLNGTVDGLYLYLGILSLCAVPPPVLIIMLVVCTLYFFTCIATRVYEEYDFQRKLLVSQLKIDLAYEGKKAELHFEKLQKLSIELASKPKNAVFLREQDEAFLAFKESLFRLEQKQKEYRSLIRLSHGSAFLAGAKTGLAAYGAFISILFLIGVWTAINPVLLSTFFTFGFCLFLGFIAHSLYKNYQYNKLLEGQEYIRPEIEEEQIVLLDEPQRKQEEKIDSEDNKDLLKWVQQFQSARVMVNSLEPEKLKAAIRETTFDDNTPQFNYQQWAEVTRSTTTGAKKGANAMSNIIMNSFLERDNSGHYHETPLIQVFMALSAVFHALVFGLRAHARGFGKPTLEVVPLHSDMEIEMDTIQSEDLSLEDDSYDEAYFEDSTAEEDQLILTKEKVKAENPYGYARSPQLMFSQKQKAINHDWENLALGTYC